MDFRKVVRNVHAGKIAKIEGTRVELREAREKICSLIDGGDRITISRGAGCLYVYVDPLKISFVESSSITRQ